MKFYVEDCDGTVDYFTTFLGYTLVFAILLIAIANGMSSHKEAQLKKEWMEYCTTKQEKAEIECKMIWKNGMSNN